MTLIELMIGMTLSLLIAAALGTLVLNMSRAHAELDRSSRQIENGRYAIDLLADEIRIAGYFGDAKQSTATFGSPDPCATAIANLGWAASPITLPNPVEGRTGTGDVPACVTSHVADTAILLLRRVSTTTTDAAAVTANNAYLQTSQCFVDPYSPPLVLSDKPADFVLKNRGCGSINPTRRYLDRIYYVAPCSDCARDTIPTLKRLELSSGAFAETPLAEGIEEVHFEFGFDTDDDGSPDEFLKALSGVAGAKDNDWANVMAVRIWLVSRSSEATPGYTDTKTYDLGAFGSRGPYSDQFKRRVYTSLVRLNNPAGWRQ